jgi:hypothetical protein
LDKAKKLLSLQNRHTKDWTSAAWVIPKSDSDKRPTELIIESETKELPVQYCTSKDGDNPAILSMMGDDGYECNSDYFRPVHLHQCGKVPPKGQDCCVQEGETRSYGMAFPIIGHYYP